MMEALFFSAFGLSIAFAAQPGVIAFESIRRGLARGVSGRASGPAQGK